MPRELVICCQHEDCTTFCRIFGIPDLLRDFRGRYRFSWELSPTSKMCCSTCMTTDIADHTELEKRNKQDNFKIITFVP
nr:hypothetical protein BgiMline_026260 [Biomphalaria glabrata]